MTFAGPSLYEGFGAMCPCFPRTLYHRLSWREQSYEGDPNNYSGTYYGIRKTGEFFCTSDATTRDIYGTLQVGARYQILFTSLQHWGQTQFPRLEPEPEAYMATLFTRPTWQDGPRC